MVISLDTIVSELQPCLYRPMSTAAWKREKEVVSVADVDVASTIPPQVRTSPKAAIVVNSSPKLKPKYRAVWKQPLGIRLGTLSGVLTARLSRRLIL
ncbi:hypothetical protein BaRGS_00039337 [Batillaria attramentaria]|uniref:Uncharacterized protein n=1 Tax=Batillaria attramentaria TaxID=370345 RepID=A0ABD0J3G2_9CAEN